MEEIREVLRLWLGLAVGLPSPGLRTIAAYAGVDRKTVRRYVQAAQTAGLVRGAGQEGLTDELIGQVVEAIRPSRPDGHGQSWELLEAQREQITTWIRGGDGVKPLTLTKIEILLARRGIVVPYRTLVRYATERCGYRRTATTVRVVDGAPGAECQIDFGYLGLMTDEDTGARRKVFALVISAVYSRHMFVWLTHSQTLAALLDGCAAAWEFFGGVFHVVIPDNMKPIVTQADAVNPRLSRGWLDYAGHVGFARRHRPGAHSPGLSRGFGYPECPALMEVEARLQS